MKKRCLFTLVILCMLVMLFPAQRAEAAKKVTETKITKTVKKTSVYTIKRKGYVVKYGKKKIWTVWYEYPQLKGSSSKVKSFNKAMKKKANKFLKNSDVESRAEVEENIRENGASQYQYGPFHDTCSCRCTYAKGQVISFKMEEEWYGGGRSEMISSGINYNKGTGKYLKLKDVVAEPNKIRSNINRKSEATVNWEQFKVNSSTVFYMKGSNAVVCINPLENNYSYSYTVKLRLR